MPFVRCKFYSESGNPVRGGCRRRGMGCVFVHPGDSDWDYAPSPSFRPKDSSGDPGGFRFQSKRGAAAPSARDTGRNARASAADTGNGWDIGGGYDTGGPTSALIQVSDPAQPTNPAVTRSDDTFAPAIPTSIGDTKNSGDAWGDGADKDTGSTWDNAQNDGWGTGWGDNKDGGSTWDNAQDGGWGTGWGDDKDGGSTWKSPRNDLWGTGWGDNKDANSWRAPDLMIVDNQPEKKTEQNKGKGKAVPAPPRIRIPGNEDKKSKITGTNNEPLGTNKWGESRSSTLPTTSTPTTVSAAADLSRVKRKRDIAFDDRSDALKEYVKTLERGVRARFSLTEAEAKRDRWFRTQKSPCYAHIGEVGRKRLDDQRAECDQEVNSQRKKLSYAISSLVGFHDVFSSHLDMGQRYYVREESEKFTRESKALVDEVRAIAERFLRSKDDVQLGGPQKLPSVADATSIDSLRSRVRNLEERFEQAQTELTLRRQHDIRPEIEELLAAKIAGLRLARQCDIGRVTLRPEIVIPPSALEKIGGTAQQVKELDAKVPRIVEDIRILLLQVDATTKRVSELEEEVITSKETYRKQMQKMAMEKEETEQRVGERLEKIREQYERLVVSQPCGPAAQSAMPPAACNSQDKLMKSFRPVFEAMLDKFYEREVRPTLASLQQAVIEASDRHQEEAIQVLWGRMQPAMNMVAGVSRWLDSQDLKLTAPVEDDS